MKKALTLAALILGLAVFAFAANHGGDKGHAAPVPGDTAPAFTLPDVDGNMHSLADHAGKWVVLEWINYDCPFVKKHYNSGAMPALQRKWRDQGVIWYAINSSKTGSQGYFEIPALKERIAKEKAEHTAYLIDTDGTVGRKYGARVTPHMYVINPEGKLVYIGAIDDKPTARLADIEGATPYVDNALTAGFAGNPIEPNATRAYGCAVRY
jgi:hypothetical protein